MYILRLIVEPKVFIYFHYINNGLVFTSNIDRAFVFRTRNEALGMVDTIGNINEDFKNTLDVVKVGE